MLMFRDKVHLDPCYLLVVLKRWKTVAHLDPCYLLGVLKRWKPAAKGLF